MDAVVVNTTFSVLDDTQTSAVPIMENIITYVLAMAFEYTLQIGGFITNCIIFDIINKIPKPNSVFLWLKMRVAWGNISIAIDLMLKIQFQVDLQLSRLSGVT